MQQTNSIKSHCGAFILLSSMLFVGIYQCTRNVIVHYVICEESFWQLLNSFSISYIKITCVSEFKASSMLNLLTVYLIVFFPTGSTVKNLPAFHLLQSSLLRSQDPLLCCQLLRTLQTIWEEDPTNFFLLEWTIQSMTQLAACMWQKPASVQKLFFSLLEMVCLLMLVNP